jgi:hypothetical protein
MAIVTLGGTDFKFPFFLDFNVILIGGEGSHPPPTAVAVSNLVIYSHSPLFFISCCFFHS